MNAQADALRMDMDNQRNDYEEKIVQINDTHASEIAKKQKEIDALEDANRELEDRNSLMVAQLQGMRREQGKQEKLDYSTKEGFAELEKMYEQFTLLYKEQWSATKEKIRKDLLKPHRRSQKLAKRMERRLKKQRKLQK